MGPSFPPCIVVETLATYPPRNRPTTTSSSMFSPVCGHGFRTTLDVSVRRPSVAICWMRLIAAFVIGSTDPPVCAAIMDPDPSLSTQTQTPPFDPGCAHVLAMHTNSARIAQTRRNCVLMPFPPFTILVSYQY